MEKSDFKILVVARMNADLVKLSSSESSVNVPTGNIGKIIALKVLEGEGKASILASELKIALDTIDGVNLVRDNFILLDQGTQKPLINQLLTMSLINSW